MTYFMYFFILVFEIQCAYLTLTAHLHLNSPLCKTLLFLFLCCAGCSLLWVGFLHSCSRRDYLLIAMHRASHCSGFSCYGAQALGHAFLSGVAAVWALVEVVVAPGLQSKKLSIKGLSSWGLGSAQIQHEPVSLHCKVDFNHCTTREASTQQF